MSTEIDSVVEETKDYYDGPADEIYRRLWRDNVHMGTWKHPDDTIDTAMARTNRIMAERGEVDGDRFVLDVGSGYGASARFLAAERGCRVHGVNISLKENELARERNKEAGLDDRVSIEYGDFHALPYDDESFDVVWSQEALLHGVDKPQILDECLRVLRPGGRFVLSDLLVRKHLTEEERGPIYARVKAPVMWDLDEYADAIDGRGFDILETADWPENVAPTYQSVLDQLVEQREVLAEWVPEEQIKQTMTALQLWVDAAKDGKISHGFFVAQRPG